MTLELENAEEWVHGSQALLIGVLCAAFSIIISSTHIIYHLNNYTMPAIQIYVIRILVICPVYAVSSALALWLGQKGVYAETFRDIYEVFLNIFLNIYIYLLTLKNNVGVRDLLLHGSHSGVLRGGDRLHIPGRHSSRHSSAAALYCIVLYCIALYCIALHCIALHCIALYCIVLYCIALHCIALHCIYNITLTSVLTTPP
jgi:hypothetical protein